MAEFARRHGLKPERLRRWRCRLSSQATVAADVTACAPLLPVRLSGGADSASPAPVKAAILDVSLGPGVVHVPQDFDADHLSRVVAVLVSSC